MFTLEEIKDKLKYYDIIDLIEILGISSDDLIERFEDLIEDRADEFAEELQQDEDELLGSEEEE